MFHVIFAVFVVSKMMGQYIIQSMLHMARIIFMDRRIVLLDFSLTVKAVPHECVIRTSQP